MVPQRYSAPFGLLKCFLSVLPEVGAPLAEDMAELEFGSESPQLKNDYFGGGTVIHEGDLATFRRPKKSTKSSGNPYVTKNVCAPILNE